MYSSMVEGALSFVGMTASAFNFTDSRPSRKGEAHGSPDPARSSGYGPRSRIDSAGVINSRASTSE